MISDTKKVLIETDRVLSDETKWTKNKFSADENNICTLFTNSEAYMFCLIGSLKKTCFDLKAEEEVYANSIHFLRKAHDIVTNTKNRDVVTFVQESNLLQCYNDDPKTTFVDIKNLLSLAIELLV